MAEGDTTASALRLEKAALRQSMRSARRALSSMARDGLSRDACRRLATLVTERGVRSVAAFVSLAEELDTAELTARLHAADITVALPRQVAPRSPLALHRWTAGEPLVPGPFGVREPSADRPLLRPELVVVPLLAFDVHGGRLGYGAGFYDRTLAQLRADGRPLLSAGIGFDLQEVPAVPMDADDQPLDLVVTECRVIWVREPTTPTAS